jgi:hypothetical protein
MNSLRLWVLVVACVGALVLGAENAQAECIIIRRSLSERLASTPLVFVADVLKVETVILDPEPFVYRVRFRVQEAFKGTSVGEQVFEFGATAEDFLFKEGQRVLVYAFRNDRGKFSTQCSATRGGMPDDPDDPEIVELRRLSKGK